MSYGLIYISLYDYKEASNISSGVEIVIFIQVALNLTIPTCVQLTEAKRARKREIKRRVSEVMVLTREPPPPRG